MRVVLVYINNVIIYKVNSLFIIYYHIILSYLLYIFGYASFKFCRQFYLKQVDIGNNIYFHKHLILLILMYLKNTVKYKQNLYPNYVKSFFKLQKFLYLLNKN